MTPYEIPLTAEAQQFQINLGEVTVTLTVRWCAPANCWIMEIADSAGAPYVQGIPLVTGVDLLGQYHYIGNVGQLIVQSDVDLNKVPDYTSLGSQGHLYLLVEP